MNDVQIPEEFRDEIRRAAVYQVDRACREWCSMFNLDDADSFDELRAQSEVIAERIATMQALEAGEDLLPAETYHLLLGEAADRVGYAVISAVEAGASHEHIADMAILSRDLHRAASEVPTHA